MFYEQNKKKQEEISCAFRKNCRLEGYLNLVV
jgi:hypothetical protein